MADRPVIQFDPSFPDEMIEHVVPYFDELLPLLGRDLDVITLHWRDMDGDGEISHNQRYRHAHISVSAKWLTTDEERRWDIVSHELAHILVNRLTRPVENLLEWFEENSSQNLGFARVIIEDAEEQVVSDIARIVLRAKWDDE